jgi:hypothetical protein
MTTAELQERIKKYVPSGSEVWVSDQIISNKIFLSIKSGRSSKLGDYRSPRDRKGHRISVNAELNPWEFLVTFVHEVAHLLCFEKYHNKVKPHGTEWKTIYSELIKKCLDMGFFSAELTSVLECHIHKPGATTCSDPELHKALAVHGGKDHITLEQIAEGTNFRLGRHTFRKGEKQRTRFKCLNLLNNRHYWVQKHAPVEVMVD